MKIAAADLARLSAIDQPWARVLETPGWRDLNDYTADTFVYVAGYAYQSPVLSVAVARRGRHEPSYWYKPPPDRPLSTTVVSWKPLPDDGISLRERERWLYAVPETAYVRPPEPIYEAGDVDVRLSALPRELLTTVAGGLSCASGPSVGRSGRSSGQAHGPGGSVSAVSPRCARSRSSHAMASCRQAGSHAGSNSTSA
ncbi:hypothetical protein ABIC08_007726 [Bradyrhizobium sp. RT9b]|uniref:hypothetical protein n=1 Tax=unclassified Bradyrhizobium TaxID=2631580 RepID=UPI0033961800